MKKIITLGAFLFGMFATTAIFAGCANGSCSAPAASYSRSADCGDQGQPTGECYCLYVSQEPCYYTTKHCVEEQVPCQKRCCRSVPKYYEVQRCRYVPQYYTETVCKNEKEYYMVDEYKTCKKWVSQQNCKYVPRYYWKHNCGTNEVVAPQPQVVAPAASCAAPAYNSYR